jgi:BarA-like signal transduction histidine kinase
MADNAVQVMIGADVSNLRKGAREATDHVDGLISNLKEFKSEAVSTGRSARFFANELSEIIPGAEGAKNAMRDLIAAGLAGGGVGAMIEGVKFFVGALKDMSEEEDKAKENFKKFIDEQTKSVDALNASVEKMLMTMRGATRAQILEFEQTHDLLEQRKKKDDEVKEAEEKLTASREYANTVDAENVDIAHVAISAGEKRVAQLRNELKAIDDLIEKKKQGIEPLASADTAKAQADDLAQTAIDAAKWRASEFAEWKKHYDAVTAELAKSLTEQDTLEHQNALDLAKIRAAEVNDARKHYEAVTAETLKSEEKALEARKRNVTIFANYIERAIASSIRSMLEGTKSLGEVMVDLMRGLADAVIDGLLKMAEQAVISALIGKTAAKVEAISTTQGHIAEAVAGAAASQAAIPIFGPGMAAAAAAEMLGTLEGITAPLLSASSGFDVPSGMNPITQLHEREMVLPAQYADVIRGMDSGGGGGGGLEVHIHDAIDGDSVRRFVESDAFVRAIAGARRRGRIR